MKTIILNSGQGTRMDNLTEDKPKCMVKLNGETILSRQLNQLKKQDLKDIVITTGPHQEDLVRYSKKISSDQKLNFVHNEIYAETNYIYSLHLVDDFVDNEDIILMHGDLCFDDEILEILLDDRRNSRALINESVEPPVKDFKAKVQDGFIKKISTDIKVSKGFLFQPLYYLKKGDFNEWMSSIEKFVDDGRTGVYAEDALNPLLKNELVQIQGAKFEDEICMEIDTPEDLEKAKWLFGR